MIIFSTVEQSLEKKKQKYLNHILLIQKLSLNLKLTAVKAVSNEVKQQINFFLICSLDSLLNFTYSNIF